MSEIKLKPCPFCGGPAYLFHSIEGDVFVFCAICDARSKTYSNVTSFDEVTTASNIVIEAWNRRLNNND